MKIQKLTITPLENGCPSFFTLNPSTKDAAMMISQRLSHENRNIMQKDRQEH